MTESEISVVDAAACLGQNKQHVFKVLKRLGIQTWLRKSSDSHGQKIAFIQSYDFDRLKEAFRTESTSGKSLPVDSSTAGFFYLIQLEPEHDPGRFKLGFASSVDERLRAHRTAAPLSKLIAAWPCKLLWEKTAIESIAYGSEKLHTEVFRADDIKEVLRRCENFFEIMPKMGRVNGA